MKIDRLFSGLNISATALSAQRKKMNAIANNMANAETTRTEDGTPYRRKVVQLKSSVQPSFAKTLRKTGIELSTTQEGHFTADATEVTEGGAVGTGVEASETEDMNPFKMIYDPSHPDADEQGYVKLPNVNIVSEMVDMISASRAYEANVTAINASKNIAKDSLEI
jgi:flagellar basal-body rod protein FlgC